MAYYGEADIEEVDILSSSSYLSNNDIRIKVLWTANNTQEWLSIKQAVFGTNGVNRISAIAYSALINGKTCWIEYLDDASNGSTKQVSSIKLKKTRN